MRLTPALCLVFVSVAAAAAQQAGPARDREIAPTVGSGAISGIVVTDEDPPRPVRRAVVTLTGPELRPSRGSVTDDDGRFTIANLPAGRVTLTATRAPFITSVYGAKRPGRPGTSIALADGQKVGGLAVTLWRGAVVAGVLRDDTGAPVEGIAVTAVPARASSVPGILTLSNRHDVTTDDRGEFRIFGLEPGAYVVVAKPPAGGSAPIAAMSEAEVDAALEAVRRRTGAAGTTPTTPAPALARLI
jgi:hypothetical protein